MMRKFLTHIHSNASVAQSVSRTTCAATARHGSGASHDHSAKPASVHAAQLSQKRHFCPADTSPAAAGKRFA